MYLLGQSLSPVIYHFHDSTFTVFHSYWSWCYWSSYFLFTFMIRRETRIIYRDVLHVWHKSTKGFKAIRHQILSVYGLYITCLLFLFWWWLFLIVRHIIPDKYIWIQIFPILHPIIGWCISTIMTDWRFIISLINIRTFRVRYFNVSIHFNTLHFRQTL